jgi:hypothetical protein
MPTMWPFRQLIPKLHPRSKLSNLNNLTLEVSWKDVTREIDQTNAFLNRLSIR